MDLKELQNSLVEHQKKKDELCETISDVLHEMKELQDKYNEAIKAGQLVEGGILLLDSLIATEKSDG